MLAPWTGGGNTGDTDKGESERTLSKFMIGGGAYLTLHRPLGLAGGYLTADVPLPLKVVDERRLRQQRCQHLLESNGPIHVQDTAPPLLSAADQHSVIGDVLALQRARADHRIRRHRRVISGFLVRRLRCRRLQLSLSQSLTHLSLGRPCLSRPLLPSSGRGLSFFLLLAAVVKLLANFADSQKQAGDSGDGVVELLLQRLLAEHVVERLTQLNELLLGVTHR